MQVRRCLQLSLLCLLLVASSNVSLQDIWVATPNADCVLLQAKLSGSSVALAVQCGIDSSQMQLESRSVAAQTSKSSTVSCRHPFTVVQVCRRQAAAESSQRRGTARGQAWLHTCPSHVGLLPFDKHRKYFLAKPLWGKATYSPPEKPSAVAERSSRSTWLLPAAALGFTSLVDISDLFTAVRRGQCEDSLLYHKRR